MGSPRFIPQKRIALDGRQWWCVYDTQRHGWSTYLCHGKYRTRKACQYAIDHADKGWFSTTVEMLFGENVHFYP